MKTLKFMINFWNKVEYLLNKIVLSCLKKKLLRGWTARWEPCGPTPVLAVHEINKKSGSLGLKNRFSSRFPVYTVRPPGPVQFWKP